MAWACRRRLFRRRPNRRRRKPLAGDRAALIGREQVKQPWLGLRGLCLVRHDCFGHGSPTFQQDDTWLLVIRVT
jgi:hypothetical protein